MTKRPWATDRSKGAKLARLADKLGMHPADVAADPKHAKKNLTAEHVAHANRLLHAWSQDITKRADALNTARGHNDAPSFEQVPKPASTPQPAEEPKKANTGPKEKDCWGSREGTVSHQLNAAILQGKCRSIDALCDATGVKRSRCKAHVKWLAERKYITIVDRFSFAVDHRN